MQLEQDVDRFKIWKVIGGSFLQELIDVEGDGMADMVFRCIQEMDIDNRMMVLTFFPYCTPDIYLNAVNGFDYPVKLLGGDIKTITYLT